MSQQDNDSYRVERDSLGDVEVSNDKYWGAQTQRSIRYFSIGRNRMPPEVIQAIILIKKAAAKANCDLKKLDTAKADVISQAVDELLTGQWQNRQNKTCYWLDQFPLHVWMTGSGTQCNMNVNEVVANRAIEILGGQLGSKTPVHPNDHVNMSQSSNDVFPTAMHMAISRALIKKLIPSIEKMRNALGTKAHMWRKIVKIGRTHMQDAVPMTLGQEFSGYSTLLFDNVIRLNVALHELYPLTLGGTAIGTGLNAPTAFPEFAVKYISVFTEIPFVPAEDKFALQGSHDALVVVSGHLRTLANSLYKIANDIRLLSCGPRAGLYELIIPANEPGSSIMPGKVNPTQCEAMAMAAVQVMGYDTAVGFAGASGSLEMNVYKPLMIYNILESIYLLADCSQNFTDFLLEGMEPNHERIEHYVSRSLMLVTALNPIIGYDKASSIAHEAQKHDLTLREATLKLGYLSAEEFDKVMNPYLMAHPPYN